MTRLPVAMPKCLFGFKETEVGLTGRQLLERECETKLLLELLFGPSSELYQKLYDQKLINDSFSVNYFITYRICFFRDRRRYTQNRNGFSIRSRKKSWKCGANRASRNGILNNSQKENRFIHAHAQFIGSDRQ